MNALYLNSDERNRNPAIDRQGLIFPSQFEAFKIRRPGLITWGILLSLLLLMILVALVSNVAIVVNRKMEIQNSADAIAYSSSVWVARGMNSVSATNHAIGEMNALFTIHHALGGKWLDVHYSDKKRNGGDWKFTWPAPFEFGGLWYQLTDMMLMINYYICEFLCFINDLEEWIPPWLNSGPSPDGDHYDRVKKHPIADINSAIWEGKENLKNQMVAAYALHISGCITYINGHREYYTPDVYVIVPVPWPLNFQHQAAGISMMNAGAATKRAAKSMEDYIHMQYKFLDSVESVAMSLAPAKLMLPSIIEAVHTYQKLSTTVEIPLRAYNTAKNVGNRTGCAGLALGDLPDLAGGSVYEIGSNLSQIFPSMPVEHEKVTREGRSQMVRATYPWVRKWRFNIHLALTLGAATSRANDGFVKWTNKYSMYSSQWLRTDTSRNCDNDLTVINRRKRSTGERGKGVKLFTIKELDDRGQKSQEIWNKTGLAGSKKADELFCCMGFAKSEKPKVLSQQFFRQENPHGIACYSQAMIYNANKQAPPSPSSATNQPAVAWDTLAWDHEAQRVREWEDPDFWERLFDFSPYSPEPEPKIKLNWQAKLTPVTVHKIVKTAPGAMALDGDWRTILWNARESQFVLQNH